MAQASLATPFAMHSRVRDVGAGRASLLRRVSATPGLSEAALTRVLLELDPLDDVRHVLSDALTSRIDSLATYIKVPLRDGTTFDWPVIKLQTFLKESVRHCPEFRVEFERACVRTPPSMATPWKILIYLDGVTPGNVVRPDNSRKLTCFYMSFLEFRNYLRHEASWLLVTVIRDTKAAEVIGGVSNLCRLLVRDMVMGADSFAFAGVVVGGRLVWARVHRWMGDELALKYVLDYKGFRGLHPCIDCKNCVAISRVEGESLVDHDGGGYLVDIACAEFARFDRASAEDVWESYDLLEAMERMGGNAEAMDRAQKAFGLNLNPQGILADKPLRTHVNSKMTCRDPMHTLLANGVSNVEIWLLLSRWKAVVPTFSKDDLTNFVSANWHFPGCMTANLKQMFSDVRWNKSANSGSLYGFASEMLALYPVLRHFVEKMMALSPCGRRV